MGPGRQGSLRGGDRYKLVAEAAEPVPRRQD